MLSLTEMNAGKAKCTLVHSFFCQIALNKIFSLFIYYFFPCTKSPIVRIFVYFKSMNHEYARIVLKATIIETKGHHNSKKNLEAREKNRIKQKNPGEFSEIGCDWLEIELMNVWNENKAKKRATGKNICMFLLLLLLLFPCVCWCWWELLQFFLLLPTTTTVKNIHKTNIYEVWFFFRVVSAQITYTHFHLIDQKTMNFRIKS